MGQTLDSPTLSTLGDHAGSSLVPMFPCSKYRYSDTQVRFLAHMVT